MDRQQISGRLGELSRLQTLLDALPGTGGALVLHGDPGIGKSTLLDWAAAQAVSLGARVVSVTAAEDESGVSLEGLRRLSNRLPRAASQAVAEAVEGRSLAKAAFALLDVVGAMAADQPVVIAVDDGHWMDHASWTALTFMARRLTDKPALVLLAMRAGAVTFARLPSSGLADLPIEPLDVGAARELLSRRAPSLPPDLAERVLALARGNPLGLVELSEVARAETFSAVDLPLTDRLIRTFAHVVGGLPQPTQTLVEVAAFNDGPASPEIVAAARLLNPAVSEEDLGPAVAERVLQLPTDVRITFRHPLMHSAVRHATDIDRRRQIHQALSSVLSGDSARQLWHQASAAAAPDADNRAAQLNEDPATRAAPLLLAAYRAHAAGDITTVKRLLDALADGVPSSGAQAHQALIREAIDTTRHQDTDSARPFLSVIEALKGQGEIELALASVDFQAPHLLYAEVDPAARDRLADLVQRLPVADDDLRKLCFLGLAAPVTHYPAVLPVVRQQATTLTAGPAELHRLAQAAFAIGALPVALRLASAAVPGLRAQRLLGLLGQASTLQAVLAAQLGNVTLAEASTAEARWVAAETTQPHSAAYADLADAGAAAQQGHDLSALALADTAERKLHLTGAPLEPSLAQLVRGQAAAAAGRFDVAFDSLRALFHPHLRPYHATLRFWALPLLAEAAMLCGRQEQLAEVMDDLAPMRGIGLPVLQVGLAYGEAVLVDDEEGYRTALSREDLGDWPLELARLQLAYGGWLRRQRRSVEARPLLRSAVNLFGGLGVTPWAARAEAELRASGERTRLDSAVWQSLTPQELQIAHLAAEGLSNQRIASRLVLSPRTIDSHLYRTFRKLGITSRTQLSDLLSSESGDRTKRTGR